MTQKNDSSVRNAEAAHNHNTPSFEEVYAIPYVRESIESLLDQNVRQYKMLAGYKDDLRQEILIHLNGELPKFNPEKSSIQTFARIAILSGMRMARRRYYTRTNITLLNSLDVMAFEDHDDDSTDLCEEDCRVYASHAKNNVYMEMFASDVREVIASFPPLLRSIAEKMLEGASIRTVERTFGIAHATFQRKYLPELRRLFSQKYL